MRKWIDQSTFDELLLANAEDNIERAIRSASAVLEAVQAVRSGGSLVLPCYTRRGQPEKLFRGSLHRFPKKRHPVSRPPILLSKNLITTCRFDWSFFRYADNYSYGKAFDKQSAPNRIGVFTKRKIDDWVEYLTQGFRTLETDRCGKRADNNRVPQPVGGSVRCGLGS